MQKPRYPSPHSKIQTKPQLPAPSPHINMVIKKSIFISARMRPILLLCVWCVISCCVFADDEGGGFLVRRENRKTVVSTENGEILAARVGDDVDGASYLLHFFTMDPNSLFLPVLLHSDMVFYVHTGSGKLSWTEESELKTTDLRRGDVYRVKEGAVFFLQSNLETDAARQRLRIHAIFANSNTDLHEPTTGPYSSIRDMVLGFDKKVLQAAFKVPVEEIEELLNGTKPPAIIHQDSKSHGRARELETKILGSLLGSRTYNIFELNKKMGKSSAKSFNLFKEDKDFENCNGWSTTVTRKKLSALKGTNIGVYMVNLTTGSMMGPHWNPVATEIAVVLQGRGMIRVVCSSVLNETGCRNMSFEVEEGDVFAVPRFHPMAQLAFNNETFVFMGFSNSEKKNHPQFLAGQASVLRTLDKDVLAMSFNVKNGTMDQLLASQEDSVILGCISCAEEELKILEEEKEREREEAREREEEEARKREEERRREEEEAREKEEEEERRRKEEEEARKREEERRKKEEEARKKEEEEAKRQEEERKRQEEEEEEEEERRKREEEAKEREEEEAKRQEEEKERQEEEEEEEERRKREEEAREREEEEAKRQEEERKRQEEEEETRRKEEEEERKREEKRQRKEEEAREREEEEAERQEEERRKQEEEEEESRRKEEEVRRQEEEEEEEVRRQEEEEEEEERREEAKRQREEEEEHEAMEREEEEGRQRERERRGEEEQQERRGRRSEEEEAAEEERRREEEEETEREEEERRREEEEQRGRQ